MFVNVFFSHFKRLLAKHSKLSTTPLELLQKPTTPQNFKQPKKVFFKEFLMIF